MNLDSNVTTREEVNTLTNIQRGKLSGKKLTLLNMMAMVAFMSIIGCSPSARFQAKSLNQTKPTSLHKDGVMSPAQLLSFIEANDPHYRCNDVPRPYGRSIG